MHQIAGQTALHAAALSSSAHQISTPLTHASPRLKIRSSTAAAAAAAAAPTGRARTSDGARQPWIIVWRRGVNGTRLWERLCPSVGLPADPVPGSGGAAGRSAPPSSSAGGADGAGGGFDSLFLDSAPPIINCLSKYDTLINGFAGDKGLLHAWCWG
jgi:hypothetical protein